MTTFGGGSPRLKAKFPRSKPLLVMAGSNLVEVKLFQRWCGPPCGVIMHPAICTGVGFKVP